MFPAFQDNQAITSTAWMIILSIIPTDLVRTGAIILGGIVCVFNVAHAARPRVVMENLQTRLLMLERKLQAAVDSGILVQADAIFTLKIERSMGKIRYRISELHERTLLASGVPQEIKAVWQGHLLEIMECLQDVDALERDLEINCATVLKNRYRIWK